MEKHRNLSDIEFSARFANATLRPELFTHEAHLRLAWLYIKNHGLKTAIDLVCTQIKHFAESNGAFDKFNKTLTVAAIRAVYHFMLKSESSTFHGFINEFPRLKHNFKALMAAHYGFDIYRSPKAKKEYLAPDLLPFD
ncbi:hypothetical protein [Allomuricauda sp. SCSIO 65647]|uniref:hypothetical protein n=1 Tax=Allomuricauda sp. SCSIO 65647 TaxID=2908843 RepID=UPI001F4095BE|nr:hypothetical protein [Muricauda sp. SCSIO 65647]UJH68725.1 hypothetical protein L0P89_05795 [Muricauda sp. SCSIO 65647]